MDSYTKVTDEYPTPNTEVLCYNGETSFKNKYNGDYWEYQLKYPITHWCYLPPDPEFEEVIEVREQLTATV